MPQLTGYQTVTPNDTGAAQRLIEDAKKAAAAAKAANESRYAEGLGTLKLGASQSMASLTNAGLAQKQALQRQLANARGSTTQSAISRGIGNTTIMDALQRGNTDVYNTGMNDLASRLATLRANQQTQNASSISNALFARNDVGPDVNALAQQVAAASAAAQPVRTNSYGPSSSGISGGSMGPSSSGISGGGGGGGGGDGGYSSAIGGYFTGNGSAPSGGSIFTPKPGDNYFTGNGSTPPLPPSISGGAGIVTDSYGNPIPKGSGVIKDLQKGTQTGFTGNSDLVWDSRANSGMGGFITKAYAEKLRAAAAKK